MTTWADDQMDRLSRIYPDWQIWYVYTHPKTYIWCARPAGTPRATINTDSVEDLERQIKDQQDGERANGAGPEACQCGD
jgi:hypothetical protein